VRRGNGFLVFQPALLDFFSVRPAAGKRVIRLNIDATIAGDRLVHARRTPEWRGGSTRGVARRRVWRQNTLMDFENLARVRLRKGPGGGESAASGDGGLCVMELVSWIASEERVTDEPACACPVLTAFAIALNDSAPDGERRDSLKPLALKLVGSRDPRREHARATLVLRATAGLLADIVAEDAPAARLLAARTRREIGRAAFLARSDIDNAARSDAWANIRAALSRLAEAARTHERAFDLAVRDAVFCALSAGAAADWLRARDILTEAIDLGAHGTIDAPGLLPRAPTSALAEA
jgi:hypothetical protein